jgi:hypothetical protein
MKEKKHEKKSVLIYERKNFWKEASAAQIKQAMDRGVAQGQQI